MIDVLVQESGGGGGGGSGSGSDSRFPLLLITKVTKTKLNAY